MQQIVIDLALRKAKIEISADASYNVVIPGKSLIELSKILDDTNELIEIVITENQILFKAKHLIILFKTVRRKLS